MKDIQLLKRNGLFTLSDWKNLTPESKKKYPDGLVSILDEISGRSLKI